MIGFVILSTITSILAIAILLHRYARNHPELLNN